MAFEHRLSAKGGHVPPRPRAIDLRNNNAPTTSGEGHHGRYASRAETAAAATAIVLRFRHAAGVADHSDRGWMESRGARLGQGHARAIGFCQGVCRYGFRFDVLGVECVGDRVRRRHRADRRAVHAILGRRGGHRDGADHVSLLAQRLFLARPRLRIRAAVGPGLLRHRAARRRAVFARPSARQIALPRLLGGAPR